MLMLNTPNLENKTQYTVLLLFSTFQNRIFLAAKKHINFILKNNSKYTPLKCTMEHVTSLRIWNLIFKKKCNRPIMSN